MRVLVIPFDRRSQRPAYRHLDLETGEHHWLLAALDGASQRGLCVIELHPIRQDGDTFLAWADVVPQTDQPPAEASMAAIYALAAEQRGAIDDETWTRDIAALLEEAYLETDDPYAQSGKGGSAADWEVGRCVIAEAIDSPGTFLDTCCAYGLLMETPAEWAPVEPFGLDISEKLVELARRRLPQWQDRIWVGDARTWTPPHRFDYVYVLPDITRPQLQREMVRHLTAAAVAPGGRLIAGHHLSAANDDLDVVPLWERLRSWGFAVGGQAVRARTEAENGPRTEIAWVQC